MIQPGETTEISLVYEQPVTISVESFVSGQGIPASINAALVRSVPLDGQLDETVTDILSTPANFVNLDAGYYQLFRFSGGPANSSFTDIAPNDMVYITPGTTQVFRINYSRNASQLDLQCSVSAQTVNLDQGVTFTATASGGMPPYQYTWSGAVSGTANIVQTRFSSPGLRTANIEVMDSASPPSRATTTCSVQVTWAPPSESALVTLVSGLRTPNAIAMDDFYVYWTEYANPAIRKVLKSGGNPQTVLNLTYNPTSLAVDGQYLYFIDAIGIKKVPTTGGTVTTLATTGAAQLAIDDSTVYWTDYFAGTVSAVPKSGGAARQVATADIGAGAIRILNGYAYWIDFINPGSLWKVPTAGGSTIRLGTMTNSKGIAVNSDTVYWLENIYTDNSKLRAAPVGGGADVIKAAFLSTPVNELALDDTWAFWTTGFLNSPFTNGTVQRMLLASGQVQSMAVGLSGPGALALDETHVYFLVTGDGNATGSLKRMGKGAAGGALPAAPNLISPGVGTQGVPNNVTLSWAVSEGASSYDVYFGPSPTPPKEHSLTGTSYTLPLTLSAATTYYWRIVARGATGNSPSELGLFTTRPLQPAIPILQSPANGGTEMPIASTLSWAAAQFASAYDVFLGTSSPPPFVQSVTQTQFTPPVLNVGTRYYWKVSARNASGVSESSIWSFTTVSAAGAGAGIFRNGTWFLDVNGDGAWSTADKGVSWGSAADVPVTGDWNGDGKLEVGVFRSGDWYLDINGNGAWDVGDRGFNWGASGDIPVVGDWNGSGTAKVGIVRNGMWYLDVNGNGVWDAGDRSFWWGTAGDTFVTGDWTGSGSDKVGLFRNGAWYLDMNGNGAWDGDDRAFSWGAGGDKPVIGDWNGDGSDSVGIFRNGIWYLDVNGSGTWDGTDRAFSWGGSGDHPIVADWSGSGSSKVGIVRNGIWYIDVNGSSTWDAADRAFSWGSGSDVPLAGKW